MMRKKLKTAKLFVLELAGLGLLAVSRAEAQVQITNPLAEGKAEGLDTAVLFGRVISAFLGIVGSVALVMFVWGGFQWLISGGSTDKIKKGKETLVWATVGLVVIFSSYLILNYVLGALLKTK